RRGGGRIGGGQQDHATVIGIAEDFAWNGGNSRRGSFDAPLNVARETVLAQPANVEDGVESGGQQRFVGVGFQQKNSRGAGDLHGVGVLRAAPQMQVANFEDVFSVRRGRPVFEP